MNPQLERHIKTEFPKRLQMLLASKQNMTQQTLADAIGMERQSISAYVKGICMPKTGTIVEIAAYFGVPTDWLLGVEEYAPQQMSSDTILNLVHSATGLSRQSCQALCQRDTDVDLINRFIEDGSVIDALKKVTDAVKNTA